MTLSVWISVAINEDVVQVRKQVMPMSLIVLHTQGGHHHDAGNSRHKGYGYDICQEKDMAHY